VNGKGGRNAGKGPHRHTQGFYTLKLRLAFPSYLRSKIQQDKCNTQLACQL